MTTDSITSEQARPITNLRKAPLLGCMIVIMMICEKMLAHTYTAITIYVLPEPWKCQIKPLRGWPATTRSTILLTPSYCW